MVQFSRFDGMHSYTRALMVCCTGHVGGDDPRPKERIDMVGAEVLHGVMDQTKGGRMRLKTLECGPEKNPMRR